MKVEPLLSSQDLGDTQVPPMEFESVLGILSSFIHSVNRHVMIFPFIVTVLLPLSQEASQVPLPLATLFLLPSSQGIGHLGLCSCHPHKMPYRLALIHPQNCKLSCFPNLYLTFISHTMGFLCEVSVRNPESSRPGLESLNAPLRGKPHILFIPQCAHL